MRTTDYAATTSTPLTTAEQRMIEALRRLKGRRRRIEYTVADVAAELDTSSGSARRTHTLLVRRGVVDCLGTATSATKQRGQRPMTYSYPAVADRRKRRQSVCRRPRR